MSIKSGFEDLKEKVEQAEIRHDQKEIARAEKDITKEEAKAVCHENEINVDALDGKDGVFDKMEAKIKSAEVAHDEKVIARKADKIEDEKQKIKEHEAKIAADEAAK